MNANILKFGDKIKFIHQINPHRVYNGTIALILPSKEELKTFFDLHASKTMVRVGLAVCSDKDNFVKSIGREKSSGRLTPVVVDIIDVEIRGTKHIYHFETNMIGAKGFKEVKVQFGISTIAESEHTQLVYGAIL